MNSAMSSRFTYLLLEESYKRRFPYFLITTLFGFIIQLLLLCTQDKYILTQRSMNRIVRSMLQCSNYIAAIMEVSNANHRKIRILPDSFRRVIFCFSTIGLGTAGGAELLRHAKNPFGLGDAAERKLDALVAAATVRSSSLPNRHSDRSNGRGYRKLH